MKNHRYKINDHIRLRDGSICIYCLNNIGQAIDHVIPRRLGGPTISSNLVLSCNDCNQIKKGDLIEFFLVIAFKHLMKVGENIDWVDYFIPRFQSTRFIVIDMNDDLDNLENEIIEDPNNCLWWNRSIYPEDNFCSNTCQKDFRLNIGG